VCHLIDGYNSLSRLLSPSSKYELRVTSILTPSLRGPFEDTTRTCSYRRFYFSYYSLFLVLQFISRTTVYFSYYSLFLVLQFISRTTVYFSYYSLFPILQFILPSQGVSLLIHHIRSNSITVETKFVCLTPR